MAIRTVAHKMSCNYILTFDLLLFYNVTNILWEWSIDILFNENFIAASLSVFLEVLSWQKSHGKNKHHVFTFSVYVFIKAIKVSNF